MNMCVCIYIYIYIDIYICVCIAWRLRHFPNGACQAPSNKLSLASRQRLEGTPA